MNVRFEGEGFFLFLNSIELLGPSVNAYFFKKTEQFRDETRDVVAFARRHRVWLVWWGWVGGDFLIAKEKGVGFEGGELFESIEV